MVTLDSRIGMPLMLLTEPEILTKGGTSLSSAHEADLKWLPYKLRALAKGSPHLLYNFLNFPIYRALVIQIVSLCFGLSNYSNTSQISEVVDPSGTVAGSEAMDVDLGSLDNIRSSHSYHKERVPYPTAPDLWDSMITMARPKTSRVLQWPTHRDVQKHNLGHDREQHQAHGCVAVRCDDCGGGGLDPNRTAGRDEKT